MLHQGLEKTTRMRYNRDESVKRLFLTFFAVLPLFYFQFERKTIIMKPDITTVLPAEWGSWQLGECLEDGDVFRLCAIFRDSGGRRESGSAHILALPRGMSAQDAERCMDEILRATELDAPNILRVYDCSVVEDGVWPDGSPRYYLYSRTEPVVSAHAALQRIINDSREIVRLGIALCEGLEICHSAGIYCGYLSERSLFVTRGGAYRLGGFGSPYVLPDALLAPEFQDGGLDANPQIDLFALGTLLCRLLNSGRPLQSFHAGEQELGVESQRAPEYADEQLSAIVLRACAYSPMERYPDAASLKSDLVAYKNTMPVGIPSGIPEDYAEEEAYAASGKTPLIYQVRFWIAIGLGAFVLLLIILCATVLPGLLGKNPSGKPSQTDEPKQSESASSSVDRDTEPQVTVTAPPESETPVTTEAQTSFVLPETTIPPETEPEIIEVSAITVSDAELTLEISQTALLRAVVSPANATDKTVEWSSESPDVATVDSAGLITAIAPGTAKIRASSANGLSDVCTVTVSRAAVEVESIQLSGSAHTMTVGETYQITAAVIPADASDQSLSWSSANPAAATVDGTGLVTAVAPGTAKITVLTANGVSASCMITVAEKEGNFLVLSADALQMKPGDSLTVVAASSAGYYPDMALSWSSSAPGVAVVDQNGTITALSAGSATITVSAFNHRSASLEVTVMSVGIPVESVIIGTTALNLSQHATYQLSAAILPTNASDQLLTWISSNSAVASVAQDGTVTAQSIGSCTITVISSNGLSSSCTVNVTP